MTFYLCGPSVTYRLNDPDEGCSTLTLLDAETYPSVARLQSQLEGCTLAYDTAKRFGVLTNDLLHATWSSDGLKIAYANAEYRGPDVRAALKHAIGELVDFVPLCEDLLTDVTKETN